jgi:hypothetical protein
MIHHRIHIVKKIKTRGLYDRIHICMYVCATDPIALYVQPFNTTQHGYRFAPFNR